MNPLIGSIVDSVCFDVEGGKIREFARATGANDPAHTDPDSAAQRGFNAPLATATHVVVAGQYRDARAAVALLGMEHSRVVVGSVTWEYERPVIAGDRLTGVRTVIADETKAGSSGGQMRLVTLDTDFTDEQGRHVARQQEVLIERGEA